MMVRGPRDMLLATCYLRSSVLFSTAVPKPRPFGVLIYSNPGHSLQCNATEIEKESICPWVTAKTRWQPLL
jgi:hypothetical protein